MNTELPEHLQTFVKFAPWRWARTYATTWPHFYVLRRDLDDGEARAFTELLQHIREHGYWGRFRERAVWYYDFDGWTYWEGDNPPPAAEQTLLNRCQIEESYMYLEAHGLVDQRLKERRRNRDEHRNG